MTKKFQRKIFWLDKRENFDEKKFETEIFRIVEKIWRKIFASKSKLKEVWGQFSRKIFWIEEQGKKIDEKKFETSLRIIVKNLTTESLRKSFVKNFASKTQKEKKKKKKKTTRELAAASATGPPRHSPYRSSPPRRSALGCGARGISHPEPESEERDKRGKGMEGRTERLPGVSRGHGTHSLGWSTVSTGSHGRP